MILDVHHKTKLGGQYAFAVDTESESSVEQFFKTLRRFVVDPRLCFKIQDLHRCIDMLEAKAELIGAVMEEEEEI